MPLTLTWRGATTLPVEAEGLRPDTLVALTLAEVCRLTVRVGKTPAELGDLFQVKGNPAEGHLILEGDLSRVRGVGSGMLSGRLTIRGDVGHRLGAGMAGGSIEVAGTVGDGAGTEMRGGTLHIRGTAGHHLGAALPGSRRGMRDGLILVEGSVGDGAGESLRRGLIAIAGRAGSDLGHGMIAGSIFAFGPVGPRPAAGMRRGTLALFDPTGLSLPPTFRAACSYRPPFLTLYLRHLRTKGFPVPDGAFAGNVQRYNGDRVERGKGEVLIWMRD